MKYFAFFFDYNNEFSNSNLVLKTITDIIDKNPDCCLIHNQMTVEQCREQGIDITFLEKFYKIIVAANSKLYKLSREMSGIDDAVTFLKHTKAQAIFIGKINEGYLSTLLDSCQHRLNTDSIQLIP